MGVDGVVSGVIVVGCCLLYTPCPGVNSMNKKILKN
jgi:hypothetical protein